MTLVDDPEITRLNEQYLNRPGPTNVLAFPMREGDFTEVNPDLLGDVVISVDTTASQADECGYTFEEMLDYFLIHGILHLVGYDHVQNPDQAAAMEAKAEEMQRLLGC